MQTVEEISKHLTDIGLETIQKELGKKFYKMESTIRALYTAVTKGKNIILHGRGGYGKSQLVKAFLKYTEVPNSVLVAYEDMEVDALVGIPNIKKLTEESVYEIAFENSVFNNPGVLLLEEFLDVKPETAAALKDILSEGGYRQGTEFKKSNTTSVIICTNKSPEEVSTNTTLHALFKERFPISVEVKWESHTYDDYFNFIQFLKGTVTDCSAVLAELCARTSSSHSLVSPRVVIDALDILEGDENIEDLVFMSALDTDVLEEVKASQYRRAEKARLNIICNRVERRVVELRTSADQTVLFITRSIAELGYLADKVGRLGVEHPTNSDRVLETLKSCSDLKEALLERINVATADLDTTASDNLFQV